MVDAVEVFAVLVGVVEAAAGDLGELTAAFEAGLGKGIGWVGVDGPVGWG